jgi:hypothetical protein
MSPRRHTTTAARLAAVLLLVGAGSAVAAGSARAATLPLPAPTALADPLDGTVVGEAMAQTQERVQGTVTGLLPTSSPTPTPAGDTGSGASTSESPTASAAKAPSGTTASSGTTRTRSAHQAPAATSSPGGVRAETPAASVCLIPTGSASPAFEVGLDIVGQDLSSPLVKQFPQAFAPCPAGAVRADGDPVAAVDAGVYGLIGACVRVTRQGVPLQTSLVVLDQDLILDLVEAGAPVEQLVVPCPASAAAAPGQGGGSATPTSGDSVSGTSGAGETGALPDLLAFTGTQPGPVLFAAVALLCAGVLLVRKAHLLAAVARG